MRDDDASATASETQGEMTQQQIWRLLLEVREGSEVGQMWWPQMRPQRDVLGPTFKVKASWVQSLRIVPSEACADQRAVHDSLNPAASRAAMDGSLAADFCSAWISR